MKTIVTFYILLSVTILFSCAQQTKSVTESGSKVVTTDNTAIAEVNLEGEKVFNTNCISCHGADGNKTLDEVKDLSISVLSLDERIKVISSAQFIGNRLHKPRFPEVLTDIDIKNVAEYIETFRK